MKVDNNNLSMVKGDTEYLRVCCHNYKFTPEDKVELTVRKSANSGVRAVYSVAEIQEDGTAEIKIEPSQTKNLPVGIYKYDVQITFANGDIKTLIPYSNFCITQEVTYG